jgi:hypothetical protein
MLSMAIDDDAYPPLLIARLAQSLPSDKQADFAAAAMMVLSLVPVWGPGSCYRAVAGIQGRYFEPPDGRRAAWDIACESRDTKLTNRAPLAYGGDQRHVRYRPDLR